jgi:hypothetical protein
MTPPPRSNKPPAKVIAVVLAPVVLVLVPKQANAEGVLGRFSAAA